MKVVCASQQRAGAAVQGEAQAAIHFCSENKIGTDTIHPRPVLLLSLWSALSGTEAFLQTFPAAARWASIQPRCLLM